MGLGSLAHVSLVEARALAASARKLAASGVDPVGHRINQRVFAALEAASAITFRDAAEIYYNAHEPSWRNDKHRQGWRNSLRTHVYPVIGNIPVGEVNVPLVTKVLKAIWYSKTETARRVRARIEVVLDWAKAQGYRTGDNPARWRGNLQTTFPAHQKISKVEHHAALPYREMPSFMTALRKRSGVAALALEFTILTAARTGETLGARWEEIDLVKGVWTVPAERMKAGREHRVPLSPRAIEILRELDDKLANGKFVFPGNSGAGQLSSMALLMLLRRMKKDVTTHGFRSTMRDWAAEQTNFAREVAEVALAHAVGSAVERAYRRSDLLDKRRALMNAWCDYCLPRQRSADKRSA